MIKKIFLLALIFGLLPHFVLAKEVDLTQALKGRILLQVESYGRAWYVDPVSLQRYYIRNGQVAYDLMKSMGLGITDSDLAKIPTKVGQKSDTKLVNRLKGRILLQVQQRGEAWYVNPVDGLRYYLANGEAAYKIMHDFALGISNDDLVKISMNNTQVVQDTCFDDVAYVVFDGTNFTHRYNADQILPLASLTKLMTALVLLDIKPDWNKKITISQDVIDYPKFYVGNDATSEVDLAVGDQLTFHDLWLAMLVSSSNQAAAALVESTGLSRQQFVSLMNKKAGELGLEKTIFYDVAGLDAANVTTAKEMAKIADQAFDQPDVISASETIDYSISAVDLLGQPKAIKVLDRNYSLLKFEPQASKTGYLVEARSNVALKKNGIIYVVLHANHLSERNAILEKLLN
ncbi:MAG: D-alanyl-D-alanine carboxypeptidase [Candidatus Buchananbacteria bacterium]|nr:D-alanyl-D-alanine carboxypeptidase [Candidatus Buchananbacteria bacterium]